MSRVLPILTFLIAGTVALLFPPQISLWFLVIVVVLCWPGLVKRENIQLTLIAGMLSLIASDGALRILFADSLYFRAHERLIQRTVETKTGVRYKKCASVRGKTHGDLSAMSEFASLRNFREEEFITDEYGFRNTPGRRIHPVNLVTLGDSFTAGVGCSQEESWPERLAQLTHLRLYNLGMIGSPGDEAVNLEEEIGNLRIHKDGYLVWQIFSGNDLSEGYDALARNTVGHRPLLDRVGAWALTVQDSSPVGQLIQTFFSRNQRLSKVAHVETEKFGSMLFFRPYLETMYLPQKSILESGVWKLFEAAFSRVLATSKKTGLRIIVILSPSKEEVYFRSFNEEKKLPLAEMIRELCRESAVSFIDLTEQFVAEAKAGRLIWWRDDTHWNQEGHRLTAQIVHGKILELGLPDGGPQEELPTSVDLSPCLQKPRFNLSWPF